MWLWIGLLIVAAVAIYVVMPLLQAPEPGRTDRASEAAADLLARRETLYREIADLDFDHEVGKVDGEDYAFQRDEYLREAAALLQELDARADGEGAVLPESESLQGELEQEILRVRGKAR